MVVVAGIGIVVVVLVVAAAVLPLPHPGQVPNTQACGWTGTEGQKANSTSGVLVEAPVVSKSHVTGAVQATVITA